MYEVGILRDPQFDRMFLLMEPEDTEAAQCNKAQTPQYHGPRMARDGVTEPKMQRRHCITISTLKHQLHFACTVHKRFRMILNKQRSFPQTASTN